jgi:peptide/nickel transport system substrate-binding protein
MNRSSRYRPISRRRSLQVLGAGAGTGVLAACGSRNGSSQKAAAPARGGQPRSGGQITLADAYDASTYDPATKLAEVGRIMAWTNDSLLGFKSGSDVPYDHQEVIPALAARYEQPDAQTYTMHLQPGATFANLAPVNGRPLTPVDVKFTYEYLARNGQFAGGRLTPSSAAPMLGGLDRVETPDASIVQIHFAQPYAPFLNYAASQWLPILAHEIFDADGDFSKRVVGTGPFQMDVTASQRDSRWVYKRNAAYYQKGLPYADQVVDLTLAQNASQDAAFQTKQIDILDYTGLTAERVQQLQKSLPGAMSNSHLDSQGYVIYMNVSKPPLDDVRIRQALGLAIDRDEFIQTFSGGKGEWALAGANPGMFTHDEITQILKRDPAQARQLVQAAGYANGVDIEFIYATSYGDLFVSLLQLLQSQWKKAGLNVTLKGLEHASETGRRRSGDYQLGMTPRGQGVPIEPDSSVYGMFYPGSTDNQGRVNDPQLTPLLDAQRRELDSTKRLDILRQAIRRINEVPWCLAVFWGTSYDLHQSYVRNFARNISDVSSARYLTSVWVDK